MSNTMAGSLGGGSLKFSSTQSSFDVRKESDVIALLKAIHYNPFDPDIKNQLRDLIFAYRQNMQDESLESLRAFFGSHGINVVGQSETKDLRQAAQTDTRQNTLGSTRPKPRFTSVALDVSTTSPQTVPESVVQRAPIAQQVPKTPEPVASVVSQPPASAPEPTPSPATSVPPQASFDPTERIKEIKRSVNEKVGNPVNLIDTHNEIGREYMNALLDAMKKSNGGAEGEMQASMDRLEKAYAIVCEVINGDGASVKSVEQASTAEPIKKEEPVSAVEPVKTVKVISSVDTPPVQSSAPTGAPIPAEPVAQKPRAPLTVSGGYAAAATPARPPLSEAPKYIPEETVPEEKVKRLSSLREQLQVTPQNQPSAAPSAVNGIQSVAKDKQLQDLLRSNKQKELQSKLIQEEAKIASMDPLHAPEVTTGLNQLLSEWSLFKNSGLFGTGPSGQSHPLYLKISQLSMAAVIAGRFDGATVAIKQSITDYMNGWRYEEGIVHEHGETFEHYLRRVVKHILNKQKLKK